VSTTPTPRPAVPMVLGVIAVFWCGWAFVSPRNFGGYDEWLIVDLVSRGIVGVPYANRPLVLLWAVPPAWAMPHDLRSYHLFEGLYLCGAGLLSLALGLRLLPRWRFVAFLAAVFSVCWAPLDKGRLDPVLMTSYAGNTAATVGSVLLYVEAARRRRWPWLVAALALGLVAARAGEVTIPLLAAAPLLALALPSPQPRPFALLWIGMVAVAGTLAALPLLMPTPQATYQAGALGLDASPLRVLSRLALHVRFQFGPLLLPAPHELARPAVAVASGVFALLGVWTLRETRPSFDPPRALYALMGWGLVLAVLAYGPYVVSGGAVTPSRTQVLSAPGIGLFLAAAITGIAAAVPRRLRAACLLALATGVVAVGTGRILAMQEEWNGQSLWPGQNDTLVQLTRLVPDVRPDTVLLLLDEGGSWPAIFTFRHAIRYLYRDRANGVVWRAHPFLYATTFEARGLRSQPWPVIREPWRVEARLYPYDAVVVVRRLAPGSMRIEERWPPELPPLPEGAVYDPRARVAAGVPAVAERRILVQGGPRF
jgi:hypothetical protein